jgi:hypothetical protein
MNITSLLMKDMIIARRYYKIFITLSALVLFFSGCTGKAQDTTSNLPDGSESVVSLCKVDLARAINVDVGSVAVSSVIAIQFNDASLGYPQPGQNYAQVVTPGFIVNLSVAGRIYEYHTDTAQRVVLCTAVLTYPQITDTSGETGFPVNSTQIMDGKPWMPAN